LLTTKYHFYFTYIIDIFIKYKKKIFNI